MYARGIKTLQIRLYPTVWDLNTPRPALRIQSKFQASVTNSKTWTFLAFKPPRPLVQQLGEDSMLVLGEKNIILSRPVLPLCDGGRLPRHVP